MAYRLIWSPTARLDLRDIAAYIAEDRPGAAKKFIQRIFEAVEHLVEFPDSGRVVPEFNDPSIREIIRKPCRIVYRHKQPDRLVEIVRVWHAARGIPQIP